MTEKIKKAKKPDDCWWHVSGKPTWALGKDFYKEGCSICMARHPEGKGSLPSIEDLIRERKKKKMSEERLKKVNTNRKASKIIKPYSRHPG